VSAHKTERLLNLVICLLSTRQFLSKEQIRDAVPQYEDCRTVEAFDRMFERDKDELRDLGIPLETGSNSAWFEDDVGYRIDRAAYALPETRFEPDELAVLGLASQVWAQASLAGAASSALLKLKAAGVEPDESALIGIEPRLRTSEPSFPSMYEAARDRRPVTFGYRRPGEPAPMPRHLEPWGIVYRRGRWYVVGHDRDRAAPRVFRLDRVSGPVRVEGRPGEVLVPPGTDLRELVAAYEPEQIRGQALLRVQDGAGHTLRQRAGEVGPADQPGWDLVRIPYVDVDRLAADVAAHGSAVVALEPTELRDAVRERLTRVLAGAS
jgi:proteasome accessory factor B